MAVSVKLILSDRVRAQRGVNEPLKLSGCFVRNVVYTEKILPLRRYVLKKYKRYNRITTLVKNEITMCVAISAVVPYGVTEIL